MHAYMHTSTCTYMEGRCCSLASGGRSRCACISLTPTRAWALARSGWYSLTYLLTYLLTLLAYSLTYLLTYLLRSRGWSTPTRAWALARFRCSTRLVAGRSSRLSECECEERRDLGEVARDTRESRRWTESLLGVLERQSGGLQFRLYVSAFGTATIHGLQTAISSGRYLGYNTVHF